MEDAKKLKVYQSNLGEDIWYDENIGFEQAKPEILTIFYYPRMQNTVCKKKKEDNIDFLHVFPDDARYDPGTRDHNAPLHGKEHS